jgi:hypothetical protein
MIFIYLGIFAVLFTGLIICDIKGKKSGTLAFRAGLWTEALAVAVIGTMSHGLDMDHVLVFCAIALFLVSEILFLKHRSDKNEHNRLYRFSAISSVIANLILIAWFIMQVGVISSDFFPAVVIVLIGIGNSRSLGKYVEHDLFLLTINFILSGLVFIKAFTYFSFMGNVLTLLVLPVGGVLLYAASGLSWFNVSEIRQPFYYIQLGCTFAGLILLTSGLV